MKSVDWGPLYNEFGKKTLIAEALYLTRYIERIGSGIPDMFDQCRAYGLPEPEVQLRDGFIVTIRRKSELAYEKVTPQVTPHVTPQVQRLMMVLSGEMRRDQLQNQLGLKDRMSFIRGYLNPAMEAGMVDRTIPGKPKSRLQKYRLTAQGQVLVATWRGS